MDDEALIAWQDVLDAVVSKRPDLAACPYCKNRPLTIEQSPNEWSTKITCDKCKKFIEGRFGQ